MRLKHTNVEDYFAALAPKPQEILRQIQAIVRKNAPFAVERLSYNMPCFFGPKVIIYYSAFKNHFSIFPPLNCDAELELRLKPYQNEKRNLRFQYDEEIPFDLIEQAIVQRIKEVATQSSTKL
jgi:uncharacterized protein YdhG (YjbR/CyaY superfamily)